MRFFQNTNADFIGNRKIAFTISLTLILVGLVSLAISGGPRYGIDFKGGVQLELDVTPTTADAKPLDIQRLRDILDENGITGCEIQSISSSEGRSLVLIKALAVENVGDSIINLIKTNFPDNVDEENFVRLQDEVGPRIGNELREKAIMAIFWALLGIIIYIWWRFEFSFGIAAVLALFHDVFITLGVFSLLGYEINLPVVAAFLTIVGYSLNDTIVVFDRIREDLRLYRKENYGKVINKSINETLSRTIITSVTTFLVVLSLYLFGGSVIHDFAFAILIGVVVGTYSSIFVASPLLVEYFNHQQKHQTKTKRR
ncbi:MAG: protein translocase subunit SecF [Candidatus Cloacimonetes bacterium]|nr:protein translocase subunit SecF [Candidatus Cloacimonadota bacterium]